MTRTPGLVTALACLAVTQVLHLLDGLRTDDAASFPSVLLEPQGLLGVGATVVALVTAMRGVAWAQCHVA